MDILKLKSEIEKFQSFAADGEETTLGPGGEEQPEETTLTIGENVSSSNSKNGWKKELQDVKTSVPLSIGLALTAGVIYDGVKNRGDEGEVIFTDPWKTMAVFVGAGALGWGAGRITRGDLAIKNAETLKVMLAEREKEINTEKEEIEAEKEKKRETYRMLMSEPSSIKMRPSFGSMNTFGEYGAAVGQQGISYDNF
jgi:hypothetical protein|tara:strand:- start:1406 stop:1996 length:591 start_codon:yes stop_codon:yes gene_type:complete